MIRSKARSKKLALVLVLALLATMFAGIGSASAASINTIDRVPMVADDHIFDLETAPKLRMEERNAGEFGSTPFIFRLNLTNAEWAAEIYLEETALDILDWSVNQWVEEIEFVRRTSSSLSVRVTPDPADPPPGEKRSLQLPLITEVQRDGEARVTIDALDSAVSSGTFTFAVGARGETITTVDEPQTVQRGNRQEAATIIIDETSAGALREGRQEFRLRLPRNIEWHPDTEVSLDLNLQGDVISKSYSNSDRDLVVHIDITGASTSRGSIIVEPWINVTRDARFGDIDVTLTGIRGDVTGASGLTIAEYRDYGIVVTVDEIEEFFAGRYDDDYITAEIEIEETIANSLFGGRLIDFSLPGWVAISNDFVIENDRGSQYNETVTVDIDELDQNTFDYQVPRDVDQAMTLTMKIPITIEANAVTSGKRDIPLRISGAGLETQEMVVARAVAPVKVEIGRQESPFEIGVQRQPAPDITITEAYPGAIQAISGRSPITGEPRDLLQFKVRDVFAESMRFDDFDWRVVTGDIEIDDARISGDHDQIIELRVRGESERASTIRLYNIQMTLDRTVPAGFFPLDVGGGALVDNYTRANNWVERVARLEYVEVGTPTPGIAASAVFTIGSSTYRVDGEERQMDAAPYIKDGRAFVPIRFISTAMGVREDNIMWDQAGKRVTIIKGNRIAQMTIGSSDLFINGALIQMDTVPEISDGRTMLPIRWAALALGVEIDWDDSTRSVTIRP